MYLYHLVEMEQYYLQKNEVYYSNTPKGQVINTVGAGDSMVAGFVAGYLKKDYKEALKLGIASEVQQLFQQDWQ